jgi:hypothetical protein
MVRMMWMMRMMRTMSSGNKLFGGFSHDGGIEFRACFLSNDEQFAMWDGCRSGGLKLLGSSPAVNDDEWKLRI